VNTIFAPHYLPVQSVPSVFLAGSIEMGKAEDWQTRVALDLKDSAGTLFNPRRPDWDSSWKQVKTDPQFREQVEWELDHLRRADIIALYFAPGTMSPISLLEMGLHAVRGNMIICCPPEFWRKGDVDIVAEQCAVPVYETYDDFIKALRDAIRDHRNRLKP
jgi:nucleoside 2-deoxyribosyltransferase-like protein